MPIAPRIIVAAGTNGAGKSSIVQPYIEGAAADYFNPDIYARTLVGGGMPLDQANGQAWAKGYDELVRAVEEGSAFAFETTLGGSSIAFQLMRALAFGRAVTILYVGLANVELHIQRVKARVAAGGHDIPEAKIRERYDGSRKNLLQFIGTAATVRVWDNSTESSDGQPLGAVEVFSVRGRELVLPEGVDPKSTPDWARPLLGQAIKLKLARS